MNDHIVAKPVADISANKKKLMIVTTVPDTFEFILESQPRFLNQYYQVVVVSSEQDRIRAFAKNEQVEFVAVDMARGISLFKDCLSILTMYRVLRAERPDVVHSYTPKAGMVCAIAGFMAQVPVRIHTFTGLIFPYCSGMKHRILKLIDALVCRLNTHIVPEGKGVLVDLQSICRKPMAVIGFGNIAGVDLNHFVADQPEVLEAAAALKTKYQLSDKKVFCFVGRLNHDKGIKELCQAFVQLDPSRHALLVVGALDRENPVDPATLHLLQQAPGICWLGFQSDVRIALAAADIFVLPSYREGFPNVVLQAAAMGKPALVTDVSGSNEIVEPGVNGWIVAPKNVTALFDQMNEISTLSDMELRDKGQAAMQLIHKRFDRKFYQVQLLKFYQGVLS